MSKFNDRTKKTMLKKKLFNPGGNDSAEARSLINGNSTNIVNLNVVKYRWAVSLYKKMRDEFWIPQKVDLSPDVLDYDRLTSSEAFAFESILSFLIFLDSIQINNLPHIQNYITAPEVVNCLSMQAMMESIHASSYQYLIESVVPLERRQAIYEFYKEDAVLLERNKYIAQVFQDFVDSPTKETFLRTLIADYLLEGIYFYVGFQFFHLLATRQIMAASDSIISYIERDEGVHVSIFQNLLLEVKKDYDSEKFNQMVRTMTLEAVEQEIKWGEHVLGNRVLGMNTRSIEQYVKYLANKRMVSLGLSVLYKGFTVNPYQHLESKEGGGSVESKGNYFESTVRAYTQSSAVSGWDEF